MVSKALNTRTVHPSWMSCLETGLAQVDPAYLNTLQKKTDWLPGSEQIFNAFSLPVPQVNYVLFGESPYPREESANGYAFWDASVQELWSPNGLSKKVNRATSLRNILKMLLIAEGALTPADTSQPAIAALDKSHLIETNDELFQALLAHGFLLLNATLVLQPEGAPQKDARAWYPFLQTLIPCLLQKNPAVQFILFGRIANLLDDLLSDIPAQKKLYAEHPYNLSFVTNPKIIQFFKPLHLLRKPIKKDKK